MKPTSITTLAALILIGAGGFFAGRISSPESSSPDKDGNTNTRTSRLSSSGSGEETSSTTRKSPRPDRPDRTAKSASAETSQEQQAKLESIIRGENPLDRNRALLDLIDQLSPADFEAAVAHFRSLGITESRMGEYALLLSAWAKVDPLKALDYAKANTGNAFATNTILTAWAGADPESAIRWAESHHEGDGANPYLAGIIRSIGATDPTRATQLLTSMPRSEERGEALQALIPHLLLQGNEAARAWVDALTDPALKNGAMTRLAEKLAETDPAGTAAWLMANPGEASQRRMDDVYSAWARTDEQGALLSLSALPAGENRSNALRGVVSSVAVRDPKAAVSMMDRFPNDVTDRVVQNLVWHSFGNDPSLAISQIARMTNQEQRDRMYGRTLEAWIDRDQAAATAWIRSNNLPPAVQERIGRRLQQQ